MNDHQFKLVKIQGAFFWHDHVEDEVKMLLFELRGIIKTGDREGELTAANGKWT